MSSAPLSPATMKRLADFTRTFQGFSSTTNSLTNSVISRGGEMEKEEEYKGTEGPFFSPKSPKSPTFSPPTTPKKNNEDVYDSGSRPYDPCSPACSYGNRTPSPINFEKHYSPTSSVHNYSVPPAPLQSSSMSMMSAGGGYPSLYTGGYQINSSGLLGNFGSSGVGHGGYTNPNANTFSSSSIQPPQQQQSLKNNVDSKYGPPLTQPVTTQVPPHYQSQSQSQSQRGLRMTHDPSSSYQQKNERKFSQPPPASLSQENGRKSIKRSFDDRRGEGGEGGGTFARKYDGADRKDGGGDRKYDDRKRYYDEREHHDDYRDSRGDRRDGNDRYTQKKRYDEKRNDHHHHHSRGSGSGGGGREDNRGHTTTTETTTFLTDSSLATNTIILDLQKKIKILERDMTSVLRRQEEMHLNIQNNHLKR